jgi:hypothetical protein
MAINANLPMPALASLEFHNGLCTFCPRGSCALVEAVDLVSNAIAHCRKQGVSMLLVDATGLVELSVPTLTDRFLMMEGWAHEAEGKVIVALVIPSEYIHPRKFGVTVALHFGLICDVHSSEEEASAWLLETAARNGLVARHAGMHLL